MNSYYELNMTHVGPLIIYLTHFRLLILNLNSLTNLHVSILDPFQTTLYQTKFNTQPDFNLMDPFQTPHFQSTFKIQPSYKLLGPISYHLI